MLPFLSFKPVIFSFICQKNFVYALLIGLTFLRLYFNKDEKYNFKPFWISVFTFIIFVAGIYFIRFLREQPNVISISSVNAVTALFVCNGIVGLGFLYYNIKKFKWGKYFLYRFIEFGAGLFFVLYYFYYAEAYVMIKAVVAVSIGIHFIYLCLLVFVKIMEPIKQRKLAAIREKILAEYPDSPVR